MADMSDFDLAVASLATRLKELGVPEGKAIETATTIAADQTPTAARETPAGLEIDIGRRLPRPTRMQPMDDTGVRAGEFGLPPMARNALDPGEMRSANTPLGDLVGQYDSRLGSLVSKADRWAGAITSGAAELTGIPQAVRAGEAVGDALSEPSIPNITNAGVQSGLAVFRPVKAALVGGAGLAAATAKDLGLFDTSAQAQRAQKQAPKVPELPGLTPEQNAEYNGLKMKLDREGWMPPAQVQRMKELSGLSNKFIDDNAASERRLREEEARRLGEAAAAKLADERIAEAKRKEDERLAYNTAEKRAETSRDEILNRAKSKRFEEGDTGKLYNKLGMGTPAAMAAFAGGVSRLFGAGGYKIPMATGAGAGLAGAHWPLAHEVFFAPVTNPEKDAYQAYARELPPTHPRKQEFSDYAEKLPTLNPAREEAVKEFYDPLKFAERSFIGGVLEGPLSGLLGAELANAPKVVMKGVAAAPGVALGTYNKSMANADVANVYRQRAANKLADARADAASLAEEAAVGSGLSARSQNVPSMPPGVPQGPSPQVVPPNPLVTGQIIPRTTSDAEAWLAQRQIPNQPPPPLPAPNQPASAASETLPKGMERRGDGILYWKAGTGKGGHPVSNEILTAMGLENKKP